MPTVSPVPGTGLSYADLCNEPRDSEPRLMWRALDALASVLGVSTITGGNFARSKTVDQLLDDIRPLVPPTLDIAKAAHATLALTPNPPQWTEVYEIRQLVSDGDGDMGWAPQETATDYDTAVQVRQSYEDRTPDGIFAIVKVETTIKSDVYPKDYSPRR